MTTIYTATPDLCHPSVDYSMERLPHDWPGKTFTLHDSGERVILEDGQESMSTRWSITPELADKIRASAETEEVKSEETPITGPTAVVSLEKHEAVCAEKDSTITRLHSQLSDLGERHRAFKRRVAEVAMEYGERHDWCSVVREALDELGVEVPTKEYVFTLSVVYRVRGTKESWGEPDTYGLQQNAYLDPDVTMSMDDWGDLEVEYVQHDVMDIEEVEE